MPLTQDQQTFLDNYVRRHPVKGRSKSKSAKAFGKLRDQALQKLAQLCTKSNEYNKLKAMLAAIDQAAADGSFNDAATHMPALMTGIDQAIAAFDPSSQLVDIAQEIDSVKNRADNRVGALKRVDDFIATADAMTKGCDVDPATVPVRGQRDAATYVADMQRFLNPIKAYLATCAAGLSKVTPDVNLLKGDSLVKGVATINQNILSIDVACRKPPYKKRLEDLRMRSHNEIDINATYEGLRIPKTTRFSRFSDLPAKVAGPKTALERSLADLRTKVNVWEAMVRVAEAEVRLGGSDFRPEVAAQLLASQEEMTLGAATKDKGPSQKPRRTDGLPTFDTAGFFASTNLQNLPKGQDADKDPAKALQAAAATALDDFIRAKRIAKGSEEMFELSLRSREELANEYALSQNWSKKSMTEAQKRMAEEIGKAMFAAVRELTRDKLVTQGATATLEMGGKTYANPELLGKGGMGKAMRYTAPDGSTLVVKTLLRQTEERRKDMVKEIKAQRYLMNGDDQAVGYNNVVGLKGAVTDDDGNVHMVMDVVDGGDLDDNRAGMMLAAQNNALPEEARNVLQQAATKQAVEGLMYIRDQNMVHFDVKGANIFLDADGNAKVADFGSASIGTAADGSTVLDVSSLTTAGYQAPETAQGLRTDERFDTHAMGKIVQVMHANADRPDSDNARNLTGAIKRLTEAMSAKNPEDRPTLEAVLESSYLKNLQAYDPEDIKKLSAKSVQYTKALRAEWNQMRGAMPPEIQAVEKILSADQLKIRVTGLTFATYGFGEFTNYCSNKIQTASNEIRTLGESLRRPGLTDEEKKELTQKIDESKAVVKANQDALSAFGRSDAARQVAAEMKDIAQRLTRARVDIQGDRGDLETLASTLLGSADDAAGFHSVVTSPAYRHAYDEAGVDYPELLRLAGQYQMDLTADNPNANNDIAKLEQDIAAFLASLPQDRQALQKALAAGLASIVADLKLHRQDPYADRHLRELTKALSLAVKSPPSFPKVLGHAALKKGFELIGANPDVLVALAQKQALEAKVESQALAEYERWQTAVKQATNGLPTRGPGKDVTRLIGTGFDVLAAQLSKGLPTAASVQQ